MHHDNPDEHAPQTEGAPADAEEAGTHAGDLGGATESGNASEEASGGDEVKSDREEGGPTSAEGGEGNATGGAHGTRPSQFDSHE